jgi:flagellar hook-basal body complex protein FliE
LETRKLETGLILKTGPLTSPPSTGEHTMGSTQDKVKEGIDETAETLKQATEKVADTIKDTAHHAGEQMKQEGQKVKDAAK